MSNYTVVVDTSFNLTSDEIKKFDVEVVQIHAYIDNKEINVDISEKEFYYKFFNSSNANVKTAAPSMGQINQKIKNAKNKNENVIFLTTSSKLSSTNAYANKVAQNYENVYVIDSKGAFAKNKIMFNYLIENQNSNLTIQEVIKNVKEIRENISLMFIINDLKYLQKNGRIGKAASIMGEFLSIKPILSVDKTGGIFTLTKARSEKKAIDKMLDFIENSKKVSEVYISTLDEINLMNMFIEKFNKRHLNVTLNYSQIIPAVVGVHSGPKIFIMAFLDKKNTSYEN